MQCTHTGPWWRSEGGESRAEAESVGEGGPGTAPDTGSRETHHWEREYLGKSRAGNVLGTVEGQVIRLQVDMMTPWSLPWTKSVCGEAGKDPHGWLEGCLAPSGTLLGRGSVASPKNSGLESGALVSLRSAQFLKLHFSPIK